MGNSGRWALGIGIAILGFGIVFFAVAFFSFLNALSTVNDEQIEESAGGTGTDRVAIVELTTPITESENTIKQLRKYQNRPSVKAIVLRLDSPGGAVAPSQEIFQEVLRIKESGKPVVMSMGSVAASGAYYIACAGTRIVANPGTITGSIGVISQFMNFKGLLDKVGVQSTTVKSGRYKDVGSATRPMTEEDKAQIQLLIDDVYDQFLRDVAKARGKNVDSLRSLADGRVYSGRQAYALGLVDTLGGLQTAIRIAGTLGRIEGEPRVIREYKRESLLERLMGVDTRTAVRELRNGLETEQPLQYKLAY